MMRCLFSAVKCCPQLTVASLSLLNNTRFCLGLLKLFLSSLVLVDYIFQSQSYGSSLRLLVFVFQEKVFQAKYNHIVNKTLSSAGGYLVKINHKTCIWLQFHCSYIPVLIFTAISLRFRFSLSLLNNTNSQISLLKLFQSSLVLSTKSQNLVVFQSFSLSLSRQN